MFGRPKKLSKAKPRVGGRTHKGSHPMKGSKNAKQHSLPDKQEEKDQEEGLLRLDKAAKSEREADARSD